MADTKLRGRLPEGDANGLKGDTWRKRLVAEPLRPHVAIVVFDAPDSKKDYERALEVPNVRLLAFEPIEGDAGEKLIEQLRRSAEARTSTTTLDFPEEPPAPPAPLQLDAEVALFFLIQPEEVEGRFSLTLVTGTGAVLARRGNLIYSEHEGAEFAPVYDAPLILEQLPETLQPLGRVLIDEHQGIVDAEVVDDELDEVEDEDGEPDEETPEDEDE